MFSSFFCKPYLTREDSKQLAFLCFSRMNLFEILKHAETLEIAALYIVQSSCAGGIQKETLRGLALKYPRAALYILQNLDKEEFKNAFGGFSKVPVTYGIHNDPVESYRNVTGYYFRQLANSHPSVKAYILDNLPHKLNPYDLFIVQRNVNDETSYAEYRA
jgi:hypothetical protein